MTRHRDDIEHLGGDIEVPPTQIREAEEYRQKQCVICGATTDYGYSYCMEHLGELSEERA